MLKLQPRCPTLIIHIHEMRSVTPSPQAAWSPTLAVCTKGFLCACLCPGDACSSQHHPLCICEGLTLIFHIWWNSDPSNIFVEGFYKSRFWKCSGTKQGVGGWEWGGVDFVREVLSKFSNTSCTSFLLGQDELSCLDADQFEERFVTKELVREDRDQKNYTWILASRTRALSLSPK